MKRRIDQVTTRTGDGGDTGLANGTRLRKSAPRIHALGEVDETNACLGMLRAALPTDDPLTPVLTTMQHRLFDLGGALSLPSASNFDSRAVPELEDTLATLNATLPPLANFVLPAGDEATARAHLARTVCRRAERSLVHLAEIQPGVDDRVLCRYLNRTSDLLFVIARILARRAGEEVLWEPRQSPG